MPVNTTHPEYEENFPVWKMMRDVIAGSRKIKAGKEAYLPKPAGRTDKDYDRYVQRAGFFDVTSKTVNGLTAGIFRKPPTITLPSVIEYLLDDADGRGTGLDQLSKFACNEVIALGRAGILVDFPSVPVDKRADEEKAMNARAQLYVYRAENIINWNYSKVGATYQLDLLVLEEVRVEADPEDPFLFEKSIQWRALMLEGGQYVVSVWADVADEKGVTQLVEVERFEPRLANDQRLDFIPFVFIGADDLTADVDKPPVLDIAEVNIGHYRNSADYEDALYMVGQPTPVITGLSAQFIDKHAGELVIGSRAAWLLPSDAAASLLELKRDLSVLSGALADKQGQMVALGARLIEGRRTGVEAAETIRLRQTGEASVLSSISVNVSRAFQMALTWAAEWMKAGSTAEVEFEANTDFFNQKMTPEELKALVTSWQGGAISQQDLFDNLVAGEVLAHDRDFDEYLEQLETAPPPALSDADLDEDENEEGEDDADDL